MSQKTKIIFISTFILIILILSTFFFIRKGKKNNSNKTINSNQSFNPININKTNTTPNNNTNTTSTITPPINWVSSPSFQQSKFYQITNFAIAGANFIEKTNSVEKIDPTTNKKIKTKEIIPFLRYVERQTGHIYQMNMKTKKVVVISNTTVPDVHRVLFNSTADTFIYRYLSTENNSIASFIASLETGKNQFLPLNITDISLAPNKNSFFYLVKSFDKVTGFISSLTTFKTSQVFSSVFTEWSPQLLSNNNVFLTTKPSWKTEGNLFNLNTKNNTLTKILGGIMGLTTLANNDGSYVLYSKNTINGPDLFIFDTQKHSSRNLNIYSLPEKCTWDNNNIYIYCAVPNTIFGVDYPDSWYQGLISFNDYFVKINPKTLTIENIANSLNETAIDATNLFLDKKEANLFFINKKDSTLWGLNLQ